MSVDDQTIDLTGEPASRLQSAAFYALKELAPGQSVVLVTAQEPTLMMQSLDLQLGHKLAWAITEADAHWRVVVRHRADAPARDVFDLLLRGHRHLDRLLARSQRLLNDGDVAAAGPLVLEFARLLARHLYVEDEMLVPFFGLAHAPGDPASIMVREHADILAQLELIEDCLHETAAGAGEVSAFCAILSGTLAKHEHREENNLFPLWRAAWARKSAEEREEMMRRVEAALTGGEGKRMRDEG